MLLRGNDVQVSELWSGGEVFLQCRVRVPYTVSGARVRAPMKSCKIPAETNSARPARLTPEIHADRFRGSFAKNAVVRQESCRVELAGRAVRSEEGWSVRARCGEGLVV